MKKEKKRTPSSKNLKVNTRIAITAVMAIVVPLLIIASLSTVLFSTVSNFFNFSSVNTNSYSTINQIQWSKTISSITDELTNENNDKQKIKNLDEYVEPLEKINCKIYIEKDGKAFYFTHNKDDIISRAQKLVNFDIDKNVNYFGNDGMLIVSHTKQDNTSEYYTVIITNDDYKVSDASQKSGFDELSNLFVGRAGMIMLAVVGIFIIAIAVFSFITTQTIVKPINKIAHGADEIARGNLDYEIDYKSTNELGQTVESFNDMRRRLKESIESQKKAEKERQILVAGVAHDLRTPLTSAKGYAEGIIDGIADTPEKQQRYLETICSSISETEKILDDLLTLSRLELQSYEINPTKVNVKEFFDDGASEIGLMLEGVNFDFEYNNRCSKEAEILIDADRFSRVINNIISNSVKYAKEDKKGEVRLTLEEYEHSVIIEISDNGIGVDQKSLANIFDPMYRADPARTRVSQGSGLGLSVCKQIVELHSGSIWARSRLGEGLSIFISLPKAEEENDE